MTTDDEMKPLHVISIDGTTFHIRQNFHKRFQAHRVLADGLEQSVGRMQGYASLKECFDSLYVRSIQD